MLTIASKLAPFEEVCRKLSERYLTEVEDEFAEATRAFDALLNHFYLFTCCHWGCHGKEHIFEHLGGRTVAHILAAHRLILTGYYDEAMSLIRSVGEIANLLNLFWADNSSIREWLDSEDKARRKAFAPFAVRDRLSSLGWMIPYDDAHYKRLCELAVHPTPETRPNAHSDPKQPVLGAYFQAAGFTQTSWELYWALSVVAGPSAKLALMPHAQAEKMVELTIPLFELAGSHVTEDPPKHS